MRVSQEEEKEKDAENETLPRRKNAKNVILQRKRRM